MLNWCGGVEADALVSFPESSSFEMIISKDLFIFGEQDYLKLLRDSRNKRGEMGRSATSSNRSVILYFLLFFLFDDDETHFEKHLLTEFKK